METADARRTVRCLSCGVELREAAGTAARVKTNPGCPECGYLGWTRSTRRRSRQATRQAAAPARIGRPAGSANEADAAEVVVRRGPDAARSQPASSSAATTSSLEPRLQRGPSGRRGGGGAGRRRPAGASPSSRTPASTWTSALRSRVPPAAPAASSSPSLRRPRRRRHHALHPLAGLERADEEVGLAEHAVQVHLEVRQEVARAEAEARRQGAGVARRRRR